jgi:hypothetical protein
VRFIVATLQTIVGALAGAAITLGAVGQFILGPDGAGSPGLAVVVLMLAGASVLCASVLVVVQRPQRSEHPHR